MRESIVELLDGYIALHALEIATTLLRQTLDVTGARVHNCNDW